MSSTTGMQSGWSEDGGRQQAVDPTKSAVGCRRRLGSDTGRSGDEGLIGEHLEERGEPWVKRDDVGHQ